MSHISKLVLAPDGTLYIAGRIISKDNFITYNRKEEARPIGFSLYSIKDNQINKIIEPPEYQPFGPSQYWFFEPPILSSDGTLYIRNFGHSLTRFVSVKDNKATEIKFDKTLKDYHLAQDGIFYALLENSLWSEKGDQKINTPIKGSITGSALNSDETLFITIDNNLWSVKNEKLAETPIIEGIQKIKKVELAPDKTTYILGEKVDGTNILWSLKNGKVVEMPNEATGQHTNFLILKDGSLYVLAGGNLIWSVKDGKAIDISTKNFEGTYAAPWSTIDGTLYFRSRTWSLNNA